MIADNLVRFARVLRAAGMAIGPDRVLAAVAAPARAPAPPGRLAQALGAVPADGLPADDAAPPPGALAASQLERLRHADFGQMSVAEFELARRLAEELPLPVEPVRRRRHEAASRAGRGARIDLRATMLRMARQPQTLQPCFTRPREQPPALVILLDVSGSMERYARLMLHYAHGLTRRGVPVHTLTFGTRLTNVTRCLRERDPDVALGLVADQVRDWNGGTRIAASLDAFNRGWAKRLLGSNAAVLLVTDGLEHDGQSGLAAAAAQLHRMAHRLVWLNPLLRWAGFEPKASGIRALLPHVDRFLPVHDLASLAGLGRALRDAARLPTPILH